MFSLDSAQGWRTEEKGLQWRHGSAFLPSSWHSNESRTMGEHRSATAASPSRGTRGSRVSLSNGGYGGTKSSTHLLWTKENRLLKTTWIWSQHICLVEGSLHYYSHADLWFFIFLFCMFLEHLYIGKWKSGAFILLFLWWSWKNFVFFKYFIFFIPAWKIA